MHLLVCYLNYKMHGATMKVVYLWCTVADECPVYFSNECILLLVAGHIMYLRKPLRERNYITQKVTF